jgi:hypothetical protein
MTPEAEALMQSAVTALEAATLDAELTGTGWVRITAVRIHDGVTFDIERYDPTRVATVHDTLEVKTAPEIEDERPVRASTHLFVPREDAPGVCAVCHPKDEQ